MIWIMQNREKKKIIYSRCVMCSMRKLKTYQASFYVKHVRKAIATLPSDGRVCYLFPWYTSLPPMSRPSALSSVSVARSVCHPPPVHAFDNSINIPHAAAQFLLAQVSSIAHLRPRAPSPSPADSCMCPVASLLQSFSPRAEHFRTFAAGSRHIMGPKTPLSRRPSSVEPTDARILLFLLSVVIDTCAYSLAPHLGALGAGCSAQRGFA